MQMPAHTSILYYLYHLPTLFNSTCASVITTAQTQIALTFDKVGYFSIREILFLFLKNNEQHSQVSKLRVTIWGWWYMCNCPAPSAFSLNSSFQFHYAFHNMRSKGSLDLQRTHQVDADTCADILLLHHSLSWIRYQMRTTFASCDDKMKYQQRLWWWYPRNRRRIIMRLHAQSCSNCPSHLICLILFWHLHNSCINSMHISAQTSSSRSNSNCIYFWSHIFFNSRNSISIPEK